MSPSPVHTECILWRPALRAAALPAQVVPVPAVVSNAGWRIRWGRNGAAALCVRAWCTMDAAQSVQWTEHDCVWYKRVCRECRWVTHAAFRPKDLRTNIQTHMQPLKTILGLQKCTNPLYIQIPEYTEFPHDSIFTMTTILLMTEFQPRTQFPLWPGFRLWLWI